MTSLSHRLFIGAAALLLAGCSTSGSEPETAPDSPTLSLQGSSYFDTKDPRTWIQWGSYVAQITVLKETEIGNTIQPAEGGPEDPLEAPSTRELEIKIDNLLWTNPHAVSSVAQSERLSVTSYDGWTVVDGYDGWTVVDGARIPFVLEGSVRMDVGSSYYVVLIDDVVDGAQTLNYLDGTAVPMSDEDGLISKQFSTLIESGVKPKDSSNRPGPGVPFDDRIARFVIRG